MFFQLTFKKGDLITVTQKEDGGWWEGTSHDSGKTGWFPSNYVKEVEEAASVAVATEAQNDAKDDKLTHQQAVYRQQLVNELVEKELDFIQELRTLTKDYLQPLHHKDM